MKRTSLAASLAVSSVVGLLGAPAWAQSDPELCIYDTDCELNGTACGTDVCSWCSTPGPGCAPTMSMMPTCVPSSTGDPGWCGGATQAVADVTCKCAAEGATCDLMTHHCSSQARGDGGAATDADSGGIQDGSSGGGDMGEGGAAAGDGSTSGAAADDGGGSSSGGGPVGDDSGPGGDGGGGSGSTRGPGSSDGGSRAGGIAPFSDAAGCTIGSSSSSFPAAAAIVLALLFRRRTRRGIRPTGDDL